MALTVPSGSDACPPTPCAKIRTAPSSIASTVKRSAWACGSGSSETGTSSTQTDSLGMALVASAPLQLRIAPRVMGALAKVPPKQPFSALQTGNSASGVNRNAGSSWESR